MPVLHHLRHSRSLRILWLLEELHAVYGTPYELVIHERTRSGLAPDSLKATHPMGKAPILIADGRPLIESGFIIEYLLRTYDKDDHFGAGDAWEDYHFWLHFSESSMMPPLVVSLVLNKGATSAPFFARPILNAFKKRMQSLWLEPTLDAAASLLNDSLADRHYLTGHFSGADMQTYFAAKALSARHGLDDYPNIQNYLKRLEARPAFIRARQLGSDALMD